MVLSRSIDRKIHSKKTGGECEIVYDQPWKQKHLLCRMPEEAISTSYLNNIFVYLCSQYQNIMSIKLVPPHPTYHIQERRHTNVFTYNTRQRTAADHHENSSVRSCNRNCAPNFADICPNPFQTGTASDEGLRCLPLSTKSRNQNLVQVRCWIVCWFTQQSPYLLTLPGRPQSPPQPPE